MPSPKRCVCRWFAILTVLALIGGAPHGVVWAQSNAPTPADEPDASDPPVDDASPDSPDSADAAAHLGADVDLSPGFEAGQTARYEFWVRTQQRWTATMPDGREQSVDSNYEMTGQYTWQVISVSPNGGAQCTMTLDWITAQVTRPDGSQLSTDSRQPLGAEPDPMQQLLSAMAGVPMSVVVNPDGRVQSVQGAEVVRQKVGNDLRVPEEMDYIESASELALLPTGPESIDVGDSWNARFVWNRSTAMIQGQITQDITYTLAGVERIAGIPVATVVGDARLSYEPDLSELPPNAPEINVQMQSGSFNTQIMFDLTRQEVVGRNTTETRQVRISVNTQAGQRVQFANEATHAQVLRIDEQ